MDLHSVPELQLGSDALMEFLQSGLQQLEQISGQEEDEARGMLQLLQQQTILMQTVSGHVNNGPILTDIEIAHQIDSLDLQLSKLEASLGAADASTIQLLGQSTSKWMLMPEPSDELSAQHLGQQLAEGDDKQTVAGTAKAQQDDSQSSTNSTTTTATGLNKAAAASSSDSSRDDSSTNAAPTAPCCAAQGAPSANAGLQDGHAADSPPDQDNQANGSGTILQHASVLEVVAAQISKCTSTAVQ